MRIRVLENYGGVRTDGRRILPGEYELNDPALFKCAGHLVEEGVAVVVEDEPIEEFIFEAAPDEPEVKDEPKPEPVKPSHKKGRK